MKYGGPDVHLRTIVVTALMSSSVFASAWAAQVEVTPNAPAHLVVLEDAGTVDVEFTVTNTGKPSFSSVNIGPMVEDVQAQRFDTLNDVLKVGSIVETTCGFLDVGGSCSVTAQYEVIDADPLDEHDTTNEAGLWLGEISVPWTASNGLHGVADGFDAVLVEDARGVGSFAIPEPSTWVELLVGFSALGFAGYRRARSPQALATV
jgi:hypothetical protein